MEYLKNLLTRSAPAAPTNRVIAVDMGDFLNTSLPPVDFILAPWLTSQSLAMIHAPRGVGKTHVSLGIAHAVATGGEFLGWQANRPRRVLFIDGEMSAALLQERYRILVEQTEQMPDVDFLKLVTPDLQTDPLPDLASSSGQSAIDWHVKDGVELIIVDNISTLVRSGKENEAESWQPVQDWALRHRASGRAVLFVHHSGKSGEQRGTSRREDVLDVVISLKRPVNYRPDQGAAFEVNFEKARRVFGDDAAPFRANLIPSNGIVPARWETSVLESEQMDRVVALIKEGKPQKEIAIILGCHKSTISRYVKEARAKGHLSASQIDTVASCAY